MVGYVAVDLYWGRCGRKWGYRYLLGTEWKGMVLLIPTGDDDEENERGNRSLLGTQWWGMVL